MPTQENPNRATPGELKKYFEEGGNRKVTMDEIKELKANPVDYDALANGIGNGTFTY